MTDHQRKRIIRIRIACKLLGKPCFFIGDKVEIINNHDELTFGIPSQQRKGIVTTRSAGNLRGKLLYGEPLIGIYFPRFNKYFNELHGNCRNGHGWAVYPGAIKVIKYIEGNIHADKR